MTDFYLREDTITESLVDNWLAQPFLISPMTAAMFITSSHLKIMESYIADPASHELALEWQEMQGGPFIDLPQRKIKEIASLVEETKNKRSALIQFAQDIEKLVGLLNNKIDRNSFSNLYDQLPSTLKSFIELEYDTLNNASFRFYEKMLYLSELSLDNGQGVNLSQLTSYNRPFTLSTPRIMNDNSFYIDLPFSSLWYDRLYASKHTPISSSEIESLFNEIPNNLSLERDNFYQFFTSEPKKNTYTKPASQSVKVRYFGHACLLLETSSISILVDPLINYSDINNEGFYTYADLPPKIDYILLTHCHQDHVQIEHLLQLRHRVNKVIVPTNSGGHLPDPSLKLMLESIGFNHIVSISEFEDIPIIDGSIQGIPFIGEHGDLAVHSKICYVIKLFEQSFLIAVDANAINPDLYNQVHKLTGNIDNLYISIECVGAPVTWLYRPLILNALTHNEDKSRKLTASNCERAETMINIFNCKNVYVYAMGLEPWLKHIMHVNTNPDSPAQKETQKLIGYCKEKNISCKLLYGSDELIYS